MTISSSSSVTLIIWLLLLTSSFVFQSAVVCADVFQMPCHRKYSTLAASAMKTLIIILPFLYLSCTDNSSTKTKTVKSETATVPTNDTFKLTCNKPNIENLILHNDTTYDYPNYKGHTIKSFDKEKRLIKVFESNLFESSSKNMISSTTIYDTVGHVIYEGKTNEFIRWHCYCYKFDTAGHLIFREGYSSGELGIKERFIYEGDKLIKEIAERPTGKVEKLY